MKTKNLLQSISLILILCGMNQFANAQSGCKNCVGNKVKMYYCGNVYCINCISKCISANQVQNHQNQGWNFGNCPDCYGPVRLGENTSANATSLTSIYPNPVSSVTNISFSLEQSGNVSLKIFDVNGRLISTLADKIFEEGDIEIEWNAADVNTGIYFLQFQTEENLQTEKLIVTK